MGIRSTSKGTLGFGLVSVPVSLYKSTDEKDVKFHQLHAACGGRVRQPKTCEECNTSVESGEIIKGYELSKETKDAPAKYLEVTTADFEGLPIGDPDTIEIVRFTSERIDPRHYTGNVHFVAPQKGAHKAFGLLRAAMIVEEVTAIIKLTFRDKQHFAELRVFGEALLTASVLRHTDELRPIKEYEPELPATVEAELKVARKLVSAMKAKGTVELKNAYREALEARIEEKLAGKTVTVQVTKEAEVKEVDLTEALLASIEAAAAVK